MTEFSVGNTKQRFQTDDNYIFIHWLRLRLQKQVGPGGGLEFVPRLIRFLFIKIPTAMRTGTAPTGPKIHSKDFHHSPLPVRNTEKTGQRRDE